MTVEDVTDSNNEYYFTFGIDHPLADFVQQVSAPNETLARLGMHRCYADRWSSCYRAGECFPAVEGDRIVMPYNTTMRRLPRKIVVCDENSIETKA